MVDPKCYELAEHFTQSPGSENKWSKRDVQELAQLIQDTIETFLEETDD
jgi:hypothetical protein